MGIVPTFAGVGMVPCGSPEREGQRQVAMSRDTLSPGPRDERIAAYERVIASVPGAVRRGAKLPYTSMNGNMYSMLDEAGVLALRLSPADRTAFMEAFGATLQVAYGHVRPDYVSVPDAILLDTVTLTPWFARSHAYAATLKPKATTRRTAKP